MASRHQVMSGETEGMFAAYVEYGSHSSRPPWRASLQVWGEGLRELLLLLLLFLSPPTWRI